MVVFWECSGSVLGGFRGGSKRILREFPQNTNTSRKPQENLLNTTGKPENTSRTPPDPPQVVSPGEHIGDELLEGIDLAHRHTHT